LKSVVILSDLHCGSVYGLTTPEHFNAEHKRDYQEEAYLKYKELTKKWVKPDILIVNGDLIEGNQSKQGGAELITPNREIQGEMAIDLLEMWNAKQIYMTFGTAYHVSEKAEDFEYTIAKRLTDRGTNTHIEGRLYINVEGITFDIRHKIGTSSVPYARATAVLREITWDLIKEANGTGPDVDCVIRSHAHYHIGVEVPGKNGKMRYAYITPGLQMSGGRYGSRECSGETHWGAFRLIIDKGKIIQKDTEIWNLHSNKPRIYRVK